MRVDHRLFIIGPIDLMRDDRHALRCVGTNAPGVVKMMVRVDQVLNRLIRYELFHLGHYRRRTVVALRPFDDDQIILHFNQRAVMRAAGDVPNPVRRLFGLNRHGISTHIFRHLDIYRRICSDGGNRQIQSRQTILVLNNLGRELDASEIAVGAVVCHNLQVAGDRVAVPRLDAFDLVLIVRIGVDFLFALFDKRNDRHLATFNFLFRHRRIIRKRGSHDPMGRSPDVMLPFVDFPESR